MCDTVRLEGETLLCEGKYKKFHPSCQGRIPSLFAILCMDCYLCHEPSFARSRAQSPWSVQNRMKTARSLLLPLCILAAALAIIVWLYPVAHPFGGLVAPVPRGRIESEALALLREAAGNERTPGVVIAQLSRDADALRAAHAKTGIEEANRAARTGFPMYRWTVRFTALSDVRISTRGMNDDERAFRRASRIVTGDAQVRFDVWGRLLHLATPLSDSTSFHPTARRVAAEQARSFLEKRCILEGMDASVPPITTRELLRDAFERSLQPVGDTALAALHVFQCVVWSDILADSARFSVTVQDNAVTRYEMSHGVPPDSEEIPWMRLVSNVLLFGLVIVAMIVVFLRRIRAYEIGWRRALVLGILGAVCFITTLVLQMEGQQTWELLVALLVAPTFFGAAVVFVWAVGETVSREGGSNRFFAFDLLGKGHVLHSEIGRAILAGIAGGASAFAAWLLVARIIAAVSDLSLMPGDGSLETAFSSSLPGVLIFAREVQGALFLTAAIFLFLLPIIEKRIHSRALLVAIGALAYAVAVQKNTEPFAAGLLIDAAAGAVFSYIALRRGVLAVLLALVCSGVLESGTALFGMHSAGHLGWAWGLAAAGVAACVLAATALLLRDSDVRPDDIAPSFAARITERQRLKRELDVARDVQMSFLPKEGPALPGYVIAARCLPAYEVGGDYYDFVDLGRGRLGVAIGDVSGKGTQAAFYMTLTKGFLRALAHRCSSPADVLREMNGLFQHNVERGHFVSMVYAVFDREHGTVTLARAGHNPVVHIRADETVLLRPRGSALGLHGSDMEIEDLVLPFTPGDTFVFYTDGFTEAMTRAREEFGDDRFLEAIGRHPHDDPHTLLTALVSEVREFVGRAAQHDDMTMVVVHLDAVERVEDVRTSPGSIP